MSHNGLEGIVVADTWLSEVDGARGRLLIGGSPVEEVAGLGFESACCLLWDGQLPDRARSARMAAALGLARRRAWALMGDLGGALDADDAMDGLRAALSHVNLGGAQPDGASSLPDVPWDAVTLTGAVAVFAAAWARRARGRPPLEPQPRRSHASDYLRMLRGAVAKPVEARGMDTYLATVCEHGMNASTFAARVVASTESDTVSAVVAGIGALKGRLHGGAPGPVLDMLDAIDEPGAAPAWIARALADGERIMGMGHRVYRARDPRADLLERAVRTLDPESGRVALARAVEGEAERQLAARKPDRPIRANVEFYTAVLLEALGVPRSLFTATFAVGRVAGWCAHIAEQRRTGRLIRPQARYVGARPAA